MEVLKNSTVAKSVIEGTLSPSWALQEDTTPFISPYYTTNISELLYRNVYLWTVAMTTPLRAVVLPAGIIANIINIIAFRKMGVQDTVTISLLSLSISDLTFLSLVGFHEADSVIWHYFPGKINWPFDKYIIRYPFYWYGITFYEASMMITVYIAIVRAACVAMPLKFKTTFTSSRSGCIIIAIFMTSILLRVPTFLVHRIVPGFDAASNKTRIIYKEFDDGGLADTINDIANRNILPWTSFIAVSISVAIMAYKLNASVKFRSTAAAAATKTTTADTTNTQTDNKTFVSSKETQVIRSVVLVSVIFIVCQTPYMINSLVRRIDPRFDITNSMTLIPRLTYLYASATAISKLFAYINSSVNFIVYLTVNTRYRKCIISCLK